PGSPSQLCIMSAASLTLAGRRFKSTRITLLLSRCVPFSAGIPAVNAEAVRPPPAALGDGCLSRAVTCVPLVCVSPDPCVARPRLGFVVCRLTGQFALGGFQEVDDGLEIIVPIRAVKVDCLHHGQAVYSIPCLFFRCVHTTLRVKDGAGR